MVATAYSAFGTLLDASFRNGEKNECGKKSYSDEIFSKII